MIHMLRGASDLAQFILEMYPGKVVEIGAGFEDGVLSRLGPSAFATDIEERRLGSRLALADDIFYPRKEIYEGAVLLYSIRPPIELQMAIGRLASKIGADVLIRPIGDEVAELPGFSRVLINRGEARFYLFKSGLF